MSDSRSAAFSATPSSELASTTPAHLGRYRLLREIGRGAMGVVYEAHDPQLDRTVAIKTIRVSSDGNEAADYLARFHQEAKALAGLSHPGIIAVFDLGQQDDLAYMAMELLEGVLLRDLLSAARLPVKRGIDLAGQVAEALGAAHQRGMIHRDIKPANIMVVRGDRAKIMDFGIARLRSSDVKTRTGILLGSPKYMSPEQVLGRRMDHRSDLFSLGVVLYEMLAGVAPFSGADLSQVMSRIVNWTPPLPGRVNPEVPELLDFIVAKALAKDPEDRYESGDQMAEDLRICRGALPAQPLAKPSELGVDTRPLGESEARPAEAPPVATWNSRMPAPAPAPTEVLPSPSFDSSAALARLGVLPERERASDVTEAPDASNWKSIAVAIAVAAIAGVLVIASR